MKSTAAIFALLLLLGVIVSCRMAERLTGDSNAGTVSNLWPDVPPLDGARKADLEIPLGARLIIRAMMQGKINFISFTSDKTAQEVKGFYSRERMNTAGWSPHEQGCVGDTEDTKNRGVVCLYTRKDNGKNEGLAIIVAEGQKTKETSIFYARFDMTKTDNSKQ